MNILVSCNDRYVMPLAVMLCSFFASDPCAEDGRHRVFMLESELSDEGSERLEKLVQGFGGEYVRLRVSSELFASSKTRIHITRETYYRLLAAEYLPEDLDRVLWLDADMIVRKSIKEFYDMPLEGHMAAAGGYGPAMQELITKNALSLGLKSPGTYFNAGVMLMDLGACRENITKEAVLKAAEPEKTERFLFPGQDVVNLIYDGKTVLRDYRLYNCMIHCIASPEDLAFARENARIVHFPGEAKPWKFNDIHFADEWAEWYRRCFPQSPEPRRMSYFRLKALFGRQGS